MSREPMPMRRASLLVRIKTEFGDVQLGTGEYPDGRLGEVFMHASREGSFSNSTLHALAMSISLGLQHGITVAEYLHTFRTCETMRPVFEELARVYGGSPS